MNVPLTQFACLGIVSLNVTKRKKKDKPNCEKEMGGSTLLHVLSTGPLCKNMVMTNTMMDGEWQHKRGGEARGGAIRLTDTLLGTPAQSNQV